MDLATSPRFKPMGPMNQIERLTRMVADGAKAIGLRHTAIVEAARAGIPTGKIAAAANISERRVRHIVSQAGLGKPTRGRPPKPKNGNV